jgi:hypothetical protein
VTRQPWDDIRIRETPEGPEVVFDGGVQGWRSHVLRKTWTRWSAG